MTDVVGSTEKRVSVTVELEERHLAYLERLTGQIQKTTGAELRASDVVRSLVEALGESSPVNPSTIRGEADLVELFFRRFTRQDDPRHDRDRMRS
jgi:hypothetical protein